MKDSELTGKRVVLIRMEDPYTKLRPGAKGTVKGEDDMGHVLVDWDGGSSLSLIPDVDEYEIVKESKIKKFYKFNEDLKSKESDYVYTKCEELLDLFKNGYNALVGYEVMDTAVQFNIGLDEDVYLFMIDFDSKIMYLMVTYAEVGSPEDVHKDVEWEFNDIDESFDILEKEIFKILRISENLLLEKNVPKNRNLWSSCVRWAKSKYDVWPSAYACGAAAKRYKSKGGQWKSKKK